jgi:hypothetical protein
MMEPPLILGNRNKSRVIELRRRSYNGFVVMLTRPRSDGVAMIATCYSRANTVNTFVQAIYRCQQVNSARIHWFMLAEGPLLYISGELRRCGADYGGVNFVVIDAIYASARRFQYLLHREQLQRTVRYCQQLVPP